MKVLLLGATGNLGSRCVPALLAHKHQVVVFVRSEAKLRDSLPKSILSEIITVTGSATDPSAIEDALVKNRCDALINSAGLAAMFPWQAPRMEDIVNAVATASVEASKKLNYPIRGWFMGGMSALGKQNVSFNCSTVDSCSRVWKYVLEAYSPHTMSRISPSHPEEEC